ncbi:tetratricopeptide (TPR) repeat protein [Chitinivorax tropicus]|uniref:Tetratricopeptide (TPR) repeat protein n=1 Tax=Chitinivorax tropicus TaxID=714531 RepID=A0A840MPC2_9PROT|nr:tetratricopeptide repeat protein [Chitinivorax tropicus]MBB5020290.1 tetratricopeptide (TPR) repeat protein [Chitinivorax tropicus]
MSATQAEREAQLSRYRHFLTFDPDNLQLLGDVADLSLSLGQFALAEQTLDHGLTLQATHPRLRNLRALLAFQQQDWILATDLLSSLLAEQDDPALRYNLAFAYYQQADYARVKRLLNEVPIDWLALPQAAHLYILTLHQLGELEAAIALAEQLMPDRQGDADLAGMLALLLLDHDKPVASQHWAAQALQWQADQPYALLTAGTLSIGQGEPGQAILQFERILARQPNNGRAWSGLGVAHLAQHDLVQGRASLEEAVRHMSDHIGTWHALAWAQLLQGDLAAADQSFQCAYDLDPNFGESHGGLGLMAWLRGDLATAETWLTKARRLAPGSMAVRYVELLKAQQRGESETAQAILQRALADLPTLGTGTLEEVLRNQPGRKSKS